MPKGQKEPKHGFKQDLEDLGKAAVDKYMNNLAESKNPQPPGSESTDPSQGALIARGQAEVYEVFAVMAITSGDSVFYLQLRQFRGGEHPKELFFFAEPKDGKWTTLFHNPRKEKKQIPTAWKHVYLGVTVGDPREFNRGIRYATGTVRSGETNIMWMCRAIENVKHCIELGSLGDINAPVTTLNMTGWNKQIPKMREEWKQKQREKANKLHTSSSNHKKGKGKK